MRTTTMLAVACLLLSSGCAFQPYNDSIYQGVPLGQPKQNSDGSLQYADGTTYRGQTRNGMPHGSGEFIMANQDRYQGDVDAGLMQGKGVLLFKDGRRYEGTFRADQPSGTGTLTLPNGDVYSGAFAGLDNMIGTKRTAKGTYEGKFVQGKLHGDAHYQPHNSQQDRFQRWHNGSLTFDAPGPKAIAAAQKNCKLQSPQWFHIGKQCDGPGEAMTTDYQQHAKGIFRNGDLVSGEISNQNGVTIKGQFKQFQPHGKAQYLVNNQKQYDGEFSDGQRHGSGICLENKAPERCEYHLGNRVDTGYLSKQLKQEIDALQSDYNASIEKIREQTRNAETEWAQDYRRQMDYIRDEIDSAEAGAFGKSMLMGTMHNMAGNQAQAEAFIQQQADELRERKDELARMERDFNREQRDAKARFAREQAEELSNLKTRHERNLQSAIAKYSEQCQRVPDRRWDSSKHLCVR